MHWDKQQRRYVDDEGHVLSEAKVRREVADYVAQEKARTEAEALKFQAGTISLAAFFSQLRGRIETWHNVTGAIAYGGRLQLDAERKARIAARITSEQDYLLNFRAAAAQSQSAAEQLAEQVAQSFELEAVAVKAFEGSKITARFRARVKQEVQDELETAAPSEAEAAIRRGIAEALSEETEAQIIADSIIYDTSLTTDLIGGTVPARAGMYADAAYSTYENNVAAREFDEGVRMGRRVCEEDGASCEECVDAASTYFTDLDEIPEIGTLQCLNNCRCYIVYAEPIRGLGLQDLPAEFQSLSESVQ